MRVPPAAPPHAPHLTERAKADLDARREREAAALRRNLQRRKQQQRQADPPQEDPSEP